MTTWLWAAVVELSAFFFLKSHLIFSSLAVFERPRRAVIGCTLLKTTLHSSAVCMFYPVCVTDEHGLDFRPKSSSFFSFFFKSCRCSAVTLPHFVFVLFSLHLKQMLLKRRIGVNHSPSRRPAKPAVFGTSGEQETERRTASRQDT